jgi:hypothetical protein
MKTMQENTDTNREKWKAHAKAFNEMRERSDAERNAYDEKMMAKWEGD